MTRYTFTGPPAHIARKHRERAADVYAGTSYGKMPRHPRKRAMCERCEVGNHVGQHTKVGCVRTIAKPPADWVCICLMVAA